MKSFSTLAVTALALCQSCVAFGIGGRPLSMIRGASQKRAPLQDVVTWDEHSLFVHGKRVMIFSGEIHPFRLPVPSLWLDVFQKVKAMGLNCVSFYVDWAVLEGKPGSFTAEGVFDLEGFIKAASDAGIYLLARPGPYISQYLVSKGDCGCGTDKSSRCGGVRRRISRLVAKSQGAFEN
jgi:hypothetical protein